MKELREKHHKAIEEYGMTDERTVAISQELDKVVCAEQKKNNQQKKHLVWLACTNDEYELPVAFGDTAKELALYLKAPYKSLRSGFSRRGEYNGLKIIKVDVLVGEC